MAKHLPPVPPHNRSDKGPGDPGRAAASRAAQPRSGEPNRSEEGAPNTPQNENIRENTHNQGYQQDR